MVFDTNIITSKFLKFEGKLRRHHGTVLRVCFTPVTPAHVMFTTACYTRYNDTAVKLVVVIDITLNCFAT